MKKLGENLATEGGLTISWDYEHMAGDWCCPFKGCDWKKNGSYFKNDEEWATELNAHYATHSN